MAIEERNAHRLDELARVCAAGRDEFAVVANDPNPGFLPRPGSEAAFMDALATSGMWPGGPWPEGSANGLHQVALVLALASSGHFGEMATLLRGRDCAWSMPLLSRAVIESSAR
ncbi:MAG: hypothetical protein ACRD0Q_07510, partial [Acidimicrobiales bacterium]